MKLASLWLSWLDYRRSAIDTDIEGADRRPALRAQPGAQMPLIIRNSPPSATKTKSADRRFCRRFLMMRVNDRSTRAPYRPRHEGRPGLELHDLVEGRAVLIGPAR